MRLATISPERLERVNRAVIDGKLPPALLDAKPLAGFDFCKFPKRKNPTYGGVLEAIASPLYDSFSVAANTAFPAKTIMFATGIGTKTLAQTNLRGQGGVLPAPQRMNIMSMSIWINNNCSPVDLQNILQNCSVRVILNTKPYLECMVANLPAGRGGIAYSAAQLGTAAAGDVSFASTSNGVPDPRAVYTLGQAPIPLESLEPFEVDITAETAFNTAAASARPNGNGVVFYFIFDGYISRAVS